MKKRRNVFIIIAAFMLMAGMILPGCDILGELPPPAEDRPTVPAEPEPEPEPEVVVEPEAPSLGAWEERFATWPMSFGFANEEGSRLIRTYYDYEGFEAEDKAPPPPLLEDGTEEEEDEVYDPDEAAFLRESTGFDPDRFSLAVGRYSELWPIHFSRWQDEGYGNNGRETAYNFKNLPGFVFRQKEWKLSGNRTYLLTDMDTLIDNMLAISPPGWKGNTPPMDEEMVISIEKLKGRGVVWAKTLALTKVGDGQVGVVLFERQDNDMLFSIVYSDGVKTLFWDCPAGYDEQSTWRVDMGEDPGDFDILLLARFDEGLFLVLTWAAPEGEAAVVLYEEDGAFTRSEDIAYTRYWGF